MNISLKISNKMDTSGNVDDLRVARLPRDARELYEYPLGCFISARGKNGQLISLRVEPAYEADAKEDSMSMYVSSSVFNQIAATYGSADVEMVEGITLGCDPELMVVDRNTGHLVSSQYFFGLKKWNPVGYDGLLLEFRPAPSVSEAVVVNNILGLIIEARRNLSSSKMYPNTMMAGISSFFGPAAVARNVKTGTAILQPGTKLTAGFHLHYGLPRELLGYQRKFVAQQMVKALDFYVGIPSIIPEGNTDSYRRTVQGLEYGKPGMFRIDHRTFEYRTPGAANMKHPVLAQGLLGLGAVVIEDVVSRVATITEKFKNLNEIATDADIRILYPNIPPVMEIFRSICSPTTDVAKSYLPIIRSDVEKMVGYARRAESINNFFNNLETAFPIDVEQNWRRYTNGERQPG